MKASLLVALSMLAVTATCAAADTAADTAAQPVGIGGEPVRVDYYMEALCPYCANFTVTQLAPLFKNKLINYVQLDLIPYGNARTDPNTGAVQCQHGVVECQLNKMLSCAIAYNPAQDDWFPFLACIEQAAVKGVKAGQVAAVAHACAVHAGIVTSKLMACYSGPQGESLQRLAAQRTSSLEPAHQWVPWVVVNGVPLLEDDENIMRYICVAYRGRDRPQICLDMPHAPAEKLPTKSTPPPAAATTTKKQQRYKRCKQTDSVQQVQDAVVATA